MCFKICDDWFLIGENDGFYEVRTERQVQGGAGGVISPNMWLKCDIGISENLAKEICNE